MSRSQTKSETEHRKDGEDRPIQDSQNSANSVLTITGNEGELLVKERTLPKSKGIFFQI